MCPCDAIVEHSQKLLTVIPCFIKSDSKATNMDKEKILKKDTQVSKINTKIRKDKREEGREERRDGNLTTCLRQFHPKKVQDGWLSQPVLLTMHKAANQRCETTASAPWSSPLVRFAAQMINKQQLEYVPVIQIVHAKENARHWV